MKLLISGLIIVVCLSACTKKKPSTEKPKNLILMIGDGMGPQQISMLYYYSKYSQQTDPRAKKLAFERMMNQGQYAFSATEPFDGIIVDSACSATQLALGKKSRSEMIGLDHEGNSQLTILEKAQKKGMSTGLVSDARLTHATPASFAAHAGNRNFEYQIAANMVETAPDIMLSGGMKYFAKKGTQKIGRLELKGSRKDDRDLIAEAKTKNFDVITSRTELLNWNPSDKGKKLLGLFTESGMPNAIWQTRNLKNSQREIPNLLEMTQTAVQRLEKNEKGFFLMVEGGQIDWAAHSNDAGTMLHELINFNMTLNWLLDYVDKNPDTAIVVTADHETGGFGFGYNIHNLPKGKKLRGSYFKKKKFKPNYNYGSTSNLDRIYAQQDSLMNIWNEFLEFPEDKRNAKELQKLVNQKVAFEFTLEAAERVLETQKNRFYNPDYKSTKSKEFPVVKWSRMFYSSNAGTRAALIGQGINPQAGVVWATGGHTATPVYVFSYGPKTFTDSFRGLLSHPKVGQLMQEGLGL